MGTHFRAPWGTTVRVVSGGFLVLAVALLTQGGIAALAVTLIGVGAIAFSIRGYSVQDGQLLVLRFGWATRFELDDLEDVRVEPGVMLGSIRTLGNGGLFGHIGRFSNAILGSYRAYATDPARAVVLDFGTERVVVTPDDPQRFAEAVREEVGDV